MDGEEKLETDTEENNLIQQQDLHAKIYCYKDGWNAYLLLGSANCSKRGMENNVEFMINLIGKNSKIGPSFIFKELIGDNLNVFQKYDSSETLSEQQEELLKHEQELQKVKIEIVNSKLNANAIKQIDSNYSIELELDLSEIKTKSTIEINAYLLNNSIQKHKLAFKTTNKWKFNNISELDISCFLIIELKIKNPATVLKFAIKIAINNLPNTRNIKIFRDIISNSANFFKYIRFLLSENGVEDGFNFKKEEEIKEKNTELDIFSNQKEPIYENLLKSISRNPNKLFEIKKIIEQISEEENNENPIIPEDFRILWGVFEEVYRVNFQNDNR